MFNAVLEQKSNIFFINKAKFSKSAVTIVHNDGKSENPQYHTETQFQYQFSSKVWVVMLRKYLFGTYFLPLRLTGKDTYYLLVA